MITPFLFLSALYAPYDGQGYAELRALVPKALRDKGRPTVAHKGFYSLTADGLQKMANDAERFSRAHDCYQGYLPRHERAGDLKSVNQAAWLYASIDDAVDPFGRTTDGTAIELLKRRVADNHLPKPQLAVHSGHGIHCYWKLPEVLDLSVPEDHEKYAEVMARLGRRVGGKDPDAHYDPVYLNGLPRVPGTLNHKSPDRPLNVTVLRYAEGHSWSYRVWRDSLPTLPRTQEPIRAGVGHTQPFPPGIQAYLTSPVGEGGRHNALTKLLVALRKGCFEEDILEDAGARFCALNAYPVREMRAAVRWSMRNVDPVPYERTAA